jgi:hypothetical protein
MVGADGARGKQGGFTGAATGAGNSSQYLNNVIENYIEEARLSESMNTLSLGTAEKENNPSETNQSNEISAPKPKLEINTSLANQNKSDTHSESQRSIKSSANSVKPSRIPRTSKFILIDSATDVSSPQLKNPPISKSDSFPPHLQKQAKIIQEFEMAFQKYDTTSMALMKVLSKQEGGLNAETRSNCVVFGSRYASFNNWLQEKIIDLMSQYNAYYKQMGTLQFM